MVKLNVSPPDAFGRSVWLAGVTEMGPGEGAPGLNGSQFSTTLTVDAVHGRTTLTWTSSGGTGVADGGHQSLRHQLSTAQPAIRPMSARTSRAELLAEPMATREELVLPV